MFKEEQVLFELGSKIFKDNIVVVEYFMAFRSKDTMTQEGSQWLDFKHVVGVKLFEWPALGITVPTSSGGFMLKNWFAGFDLLGQSSVIEMIFLKHLLEKKLGEIIWSAMEKNFWSICGSK